ncbi:hypothetical protein BGX21_005054 [Mortierella sp. AD011]|nr:hypothetical protein BGX21_005054 [Mortierella sp. AD011]
MKLGGQERRARGTLKYLQKRSSALLSKRRTRLKSALLLKILAILTKTKKAGRRVRYQLMDVIRSFVRDELKRMDTMVRGVRHATVFEQDDFRKLLEILADDIEGQLC